jgi:serine protease
LTFDCFRGAALAAVLALAAPAFAEDNRYIVKFNPGRAASGRGAIAAAGGQVLFELAPQNAAAARLPAAAADALRANPNIQYVEDDPRRYPLAQSTPYGIPMVQADLVAHDDASAKRVCIIDSGYYRSHEDLQDGNVTATTDTGTGDPFTDKCGHGTHVAGTIAALDNTVGVVGTVKTGGGKLHIVKVFGDDCSWTYSSNLIDALNKCRGASANVVSMSLGCSGRFCRSNTEEAAFNDAWNAGVLSVAAAGNDGTTNYSYPASYTNVVSVAALDSNKVVADFSQKNDQVDLAAPGVGVLSTVPWLENNTLSADGVTWAGGRIDGAARTGGTSAPLYGVSGDKCSTASSNYLGRIVLCQRGDISFADKVNNVKNAGGVGAAIYNNSASDSTCGVFLGTLGDGVTSTIPAITLSCEDGASALTHAASSSRVVSTFTAPADGYEAWNGTSMATPHVSGVAALVWSNFPGKTNADIRNALQSTAQDLGAAGRDNSYGWGLVQARAAYDLLAGSGGSCTVTENPEVSCSDGLDNDCDGAADSNDTDCQGGSCLAAGSLCTANSECCSNSCKGKPGAKKCK